MVVMMRITSMADYSKSVSHLQRDYNSIANCHEDKEILDLLRLTIGRWSKGDLRDCMMQFRIWNDASFARSEEGKVKEVSRD